MLASAVFSNRETQLQSNLQLCFKTLSEDQLRSLALEEEGRVQSSCGFIFWLLTISWVLLHLPVSTHF